MSVGLLLRGVVSGGISIENVRGWLQKVAASELRGATAGEEVGLPTLFVDLHPGAEHLEFAFTNDRQVTASANTSAAGPGYHFYVCHLLKKMVSDLGVQWEPSPEGEGDETGYFESGDHGAVIDSMQEWFSQVCAEVLNMTEQGYTDIAVSMPMNDVTFRTGDLLVTQMGPRSRDWTESVVRDPGKSMDFFPWWNEERDALYFLNRALCLMWTEVRWRPPMMKRETDLLQEVNNNLELAYRLDPSLRYPWREWAEIASYLGREGVGAAVPQCLELGSTQTSALIGYRRGQVQVSLVAGWTIEVPGRFAEQWEDDTWCSWDHNMTVWFTAFRRESEGVKVSAAELVADFATGAEEEYSLEADGLAGKAGMQWVEEDKCWKVNARTTGDGVFCQCSIYFTHAFFKEEALGIWRSLRVRT
jgi:hypothetical protein